MIKVYKTLGDDGTRFQRKLLCHCQLVEVVMLSKCRERENVDDCRILISSSCETVYSGYPLVFLALLIARYGQRSHLLHQIPSRD